MRGEMDGHFGRTGLRLAALLAATLGLAGCGGSSNIFKSSPLDLFSSSSKATTDAPAAGVANASASAPDVECPDVSVRTGAATLMIGSKPGEGEPSALDLRYQGSIVRTARECHVSGGVMTVKVGVEGRVVTGPAGGPGQVDVPLRLAVVREGVNPQTVTSKLAHIPVTVTADVDRVTFTHIDPDVSFPLPSRLSDIDSYVIYVGFDPGPAQPEKKPVPVKKKAKPVAKKKPAAAPVARMKPKAAPKGAAPPQADNAWPAPKPQTDTAWPAAPPPANNNVWPSAPPPK
jgi:hypothetical protein